MAKEILLTAQGLKELQDELDILKTEKRTEIAEKIKVALSFGDLSENSEYDEAKNDQAKLEARIAEVETMLKNAKVVDEQFIDKNVINVGTKFTLLDVEYDEVKEYQVSSELPFNEDIYDVRVESKEKCCASMERT